MLSDFNTVPTLGVADLQRARDFYEGVLGFAQPEESPDGVVYRAGSTEFLVYTSGHAGTNKATYMGLRVPVDDFDAEISDLRSRGVSFQTFEMDGMEWDNGVASYGDVFRAVWFEDPDGNIVNVEADRRDG